MYLSCAPHFQPEKTQQTDSQAWLNTNLSEQAWSFGGGVLWLSYSFFPSSFLSRHPWGRLPLWVIIGQCVHSLFLFNHPPPIVPSLSATGNYTSTFRPRMGRQGLLPHKDQKQAEGEEETDADRHVRRDTGSGPVYIWYLHWSQTTIWNRVVNRNRLMFNWY